MIRSVLGAKRRWFSHFVESDRDRQLLLLKLWESGNRSCDFQGRFSPVLSTAFGPAIHSVFLLLSFLYAWSPRASRCDARCALAGRECHRPVWDLRSIRASEIPVTAKSGSSSASGSDSRRSLKRLFSPLPTSESSPSHR
jgi:hypothetical protein